MLTDEQILKLFWKDIKYDKEKDNRIINPEFTLEELFGRIIVGVRMIKNPTKYDSKTTDLRPPFYSVLEFGNGDILLNELLDDNDLTLFNSYLYIEEKNKVFYTNELFR